MPGTSDSQYSVKFIVDSALWAKYVSLSRLREEGILPADELLALDDLVLSERLALMDETMRIPLAELMTITQVRAALSENPYQETYAVRYHNRILRLLFKKNVGSFWYFVHPSKRLVILVGVDFVWDLVGLPPDNPGNGQKQVGYSSVYDLIPPSGDYDFDDGDFLSFRMKFLKKLNTGEVDASLHGTLRDTSRPNAAGSSTAKAARLNGVPSVGVMHNPLTTNFDAPPIRKPKDSAGNDAVQDALRRPNAVGSSKAKAARLHGAAGMEVALILSTLPFGAHRAHLDISPSLDLEREPTSRHQVWRSL